MRPRNSLKPLPEDTSELSSRMDLSEREMSRSTLDSEPSKDSPKREKEDIWELVREEVVLMPECHRKFSGLEDREPLEDSLENTEPRVKSNLRCIRNSICFPRVTSSRIRRFSLRLLFLRKLRLREMISRSSYRSREENTTRRRERENLSRRSKDNRTDNIKIIIEFLIFVFI
jgi:hypothetical protein